MCAVHFLIYYILYHFFFLGKQISHEPDPQEGHPNKAQLLIMVAPESEQPTSSCGSQKFGPNLSSSQHSDSPRHISSTSDLQTLDNSCQNEPREYTETDFLLPDKLYGRSRLSEAIAAKEAVRSDAPAESVCSMLLQILVPFLLAGLGTVSAGMLLDVVQVKRRTQNAD